MSEETFPKVQYSMFINGDQVVFRANDGEEFKTTVTSVAEHFGDSLDAINAVKQAALANGVFTGDSAKAGKPAGGAPRGGRAADAPPPVADGETPVCGCGIPMQDFKDKGYKNRWYASKDCKTKGKDKACWAKK